MAIRNYLLLVSALGPTLLSCAAPRLTEDQAGPLEPRVLVVQITPTADEIVVQTTVTNAPSAQPTARPTPTLVPTTGALAASAGSANPELPTRAVVIYGGREGLQLRTAPHQEKIAALLAGTSLAIRGAARDDDGFRWWPVEIAQGWMAEGPSDPAKPRWLAPMAGERVTAGQQARVVYDGADGLNLRSSAGPASPKIATLLQGSAVTVLDQPQTVDGITWWPVRIAAGWVAEGRTDPAQPRWLQFLEH